MSEPRGFLGWMLRVLNISITKTTTVILDVIGVLGLIGRLVSRRVDLTPYLGWLQASSFCLLGGVMWAMYSLHKEQTLELDQLRLQCPDIRLRLERVALGRSNLMPGPPNYPFKDCLYTEWRLRLKVRNQGRGRGLLYKPQVQIDWGDAPLQRPPDEISWSILASSRAWPLELAPEDWGPTIVCVVPLATTVRGYEAIADHWDEFAEVRTTVRYTYEGLDGTQHSNELEVSLSFEDQQLKETVLRHARRAKRDRGGSR